MFDLPVFGCLVGLTVFCNTDARGNVAHMSNSLLRLVKSAALLAFFTGAAAGQTLCGFLAKSRFFTLCTCAIIYIIIEYIFTVLLRKNLAWRN